MFHGILQVLHDSLLSDHLLDLPLCLNIKHVVVESLNLPLSFYSFTLLAVLAVAEHAGKSAGVVNGRRQLRVLPLNLLANGRIAQDL